MPFLCHKLLSRGSQGQSAMLRHAAARAPKLCQGALLLQETCQVATDESHFHRIL